MVGRKEVMCRECRSSPGARCMPGTSLCTLQDGELPLRVRLPAQSAWRRADDHEPPRPLHALLFTTTLCGGARGGRVCRGSASCLLPCTLNNGDEGSCPAGSPCPPGPSLLFLLVLCHNTLKIRHGALGYAPCWSSPPLAAPSSFLACLLPGLPNGSC